MVLREPGYLELGGKKGKTGTSELPENDASEEYNLTPRGATG